jgi:prolyl 4-hydroxylase
MILLLFLLTVGFYGVCQIRKTRKRDIIITNNTNNSDRFPGENYLTLCPSNLSYKTPIIYHRFLETENCDHVIKLTKNRGMMDSVITDSQKHSSRKSRTCWLRRGIDDTLDKMIERIAFVLNVEETSLEPVQVVRYLEGEHFDPHFDQCLLSKECCKKEMERYGNRARTRTFLIYLNHPQEYMGGETIFPHLEVKYKLDKGSALMFHNLDVSGHFVHPKSLHAGTKVLNGEKWIANVWVRE